MLSLVKRVAMSGIRSGKLPYRYTPVRHHGYEGGKPGVNIPFRIDNEYRFTALFCVFCITGFGAPWLLVMHLMLRPYDYKTD